MKETKLYNLLNQLSTKTLNRFSKFINSPYFNVNSTLVDLSQLILDSIRLNYSYTQKEAWNKLFGGIAYSDTKMRKHLSDTLALLEEFLVQESLGQSLLVKQNLLLKSLKEYKLVKLRKKVVTNSLRIADRHQNQSSDYFLQRFLLERNHYSLTNQFEKKTKRKNVTALEDIQSLSQKLDIFYLIEKMKHGTELLKWQGMYKAELDLLQFEFTAKLIERSNYLDIPAVNIYYNAYKAFKEPDNTKYFFQLKELIKFMDQFPIEEQHEIYDSLVSYCIIKVNNGFKDFIPEALEMYRTGVDTGIRLVDGELNPTDFRNIVVMNLRYGYVDYAFEFIHSKIELINPKFRNNALNFNLARAYFYTKEFEKVLSHLNGVDFDDVWYNINSKAMLIATYYETEEYDVLESLLISFGAFIRREKSLNEARRLPFLNFIKMVKKLLKLFPLSSSKVKKLRTEIEATKVIINKPWLLEKLDSLN